MVADIASLVAFLWRLWVVLACFCAIDVFALFAQACFGRVGSVMACHAYVV